MTLVEIDESLREALVQQCGEDVLNEALKRTTPETSEGELYSIIEEVKLELSNKQKEQSVEPVQSGMLSSMVKYMQNNEPVQQAQQPIQQQQTTVQQPQQQPVKQQSQQQPVQKPQQQQTVQQAQQKPVQQQPVQQPVQKAQQQPVQQPVQQAQKPAQQQTVQREQQPKLQGSEILVYEKDITDAIRMNYNTTAVNAADLEQRVRGNPALRLDVYDNIYVSILNQIREPFIAQAVYDCLSAWENNEDVINFIKRYLISKGIPEDKLEEERELLVKRLPDKVKNEDSPLLYKQFKSIEYTMQKKAEIANKEVFEDPEASATYMASMENSREDGVPIEIANTVASEDALTVKRNKGVSSALGSTVGSVVKIKYAMQENYNAAMKDAMGEFSPRFESDYAASKERKAELRQEKEMRKKQQEQSQSRSTTQYNSRTPQYHNSNVSRADKLVGGDISFNVPKWLIAMGVHVLVIIVLALIKGWGLAILPGGGLLVASLGFIKHARGGDNAIPLVVAGYAIAVIAMLII